MLTLLLLHVTLAVPPAALAPAVLRTAVTEAAAVWAPYGVAIDAAAPCGWASDDSTLLTVVVVRTRQPGAARFWSGPLGAISFAADGAPSTTITVFLTDILSILTDTKVLGAAESQWPPALRDRLVGRVVGRVMAHEIGHFLLRTTQHTTAGLMRSMQQVDELGAPSGRGFTLSPAEAARLQLAAPSAGPVMTEVGR
jgi:hypothetical protein